METIKIIPREKEIDWDYDEEADVFYISFGEPKPALGMDIGEGIILRYDENAGEIVGMTIVGIRSALLKLLKEKISGKRMPFKK